ncbi:Phenylpropionate dioxygenase, large terminal subunit [Bryocella elongata]|uniref:Phenylpropionate dioxygenase, large terminal subunit n=1 Tax=Bryocella elongata TaxID=863522 RepID=A0A1H5VVA5_9BACT|nr:aromatic ring-hydroxylating dioxygenase subunit alpha [Bryocella elongata]SEF90936.1 Phenylpropionate dioxygenase, large terminal subunit [Bryocella elongata]
MSSVPIGPASGIKDPLLHQQWFALAWSEEVARGQLLPRVLLARDVVLWRADDGSIHAWQDLCIHRGAKLSLGSVRQDCVVCPYHGWEYDRSGACVKIPAQPHLPPPIKARAQTFHTRERYGAIWVCLGQPGAGVPHFGMGDDPDFRLVAAGPYRFRALGPRLIENFLDVAHLGIVHTELLGDSQHTEIEDYEVGRGTDQNGAGPEATAIRIWQPDPDGTGVPALVTYRYWVGAPLTAGLEKVSGEDSPASTRRFGLFTQVVPIDDEHCEMRMIIAMNYGHDVPAEEIRSFQDKVAYQDKAIVESQHPELLPLDLQAELHLRSDRMAIAYRKWLTEIGMTYGTE